MIRYWPLFALLPALTLAAPLSAAEVTVAVAANFTAPMQDIAADFARASGHRASLSFAATGKLFAQIANGAPFEVLLAADEETPARLEKDGLAVRGSRFTYAIERLALWSAQEGKVDDQQQVLTRGGISHLALANPKTAPYGAAAIEVMQKIGVLEALRPTFVLGENLSQAYQFAASALLAYLRGERARAIIESYGYER